MEKTSSMIRIIVIKYYTRNSKASFPSKYQHNVENKQAALRMCIFGKLDWVFPFFARSFFVDISATNDGEKM